MSSRRAWPRGLPVPLTPLVGRQRELAEVIRLVGTHRLVTLTGAGGVGKTRFAIEVGAKASAYLPDGVQFVDLSAVGDPALVAGAVATALGIEERAGTDLENRLILVLRPQRRLVILDNCEHLLGACSPLAAGILAACPGVSILATSRENLAVPGEVTWRVPSLAFPGRDQRPAPADLESYEAAALFLARARANRPNMVVGSDGAAAVTAICRQLDGIPLALELAAARAGSLSLGEIAERLTGRLELLARGSGPARHQTLLASIEWSYQLLGAGERALFHRLAIFAGGWSLEGAEAVCAGGAAGAADVARLLAALVDKSLVQVEWSATEARYRLLEAIRVFALERLKASGELAAMRARHGDYFAAVGEGSAVLLVGPEQARRASQLDHERDNLRAARAWCAEDPARAGLGLRLASGLWEYFHIRGMLEEGTEWLADVLQRARGDGPGDTLARAAALNGLGVIVSISGDYQRGSGYFAQSIALYERTGDRCGLSRAWTHLGNARAIKGDRPGSAEAFGRGLEVAKECGNPWYEAFAIYLAGFAATIWDDTVTARAAMAESTARFARAGDRRAVGYAQMVLGGCLVADGCWDEALPRLRQAMQIFNALPERWGLLTCTGILAWATAESGDWAQTARLLGVAEALGERISGRLFPHMQATANALTDRAGQELGPRAEARFEEGRAIGRTDRIVASLWPGPAADPAAAAVADLPLTAREREVAGLIAEGLTNRQIGERLFIAHRTVDTHVAHIRARLGCASRSQVAAIVAARSLAK
jgi:predicted ATPase/DNA-binding CsgD family transcriptional regulator